MTAFKAKSLLDFHQAILRGAYEISYITMSAAELAC
jgi:hypothetical protein